MRRTAAVLLVLYVVLVARVTLTDQAGARAVVGLADLWWGRIFADERLARLIRDEAFANVLLFVPLGLLVTVVTRNPLASLLWCVAGSVAIEFVQLTLLPTRVPTLDDVRRNGLGAAVGVLLALPVLLVPLRQESGSRSRVLT